MMVCSTVTIVERKSPLEDDGIKRVAARTTSFLIGGMGQPGCSE